MQVAWPCWMAPPAFCDSHMISSHHLCFLPQAAPVAISTVCVELLRGTFAWSGWNFGECPASLAHTLFPESSDASTDMASLLVREHFKALLLRADHRWCEVQLRTGHVLDGSSQVAPYPAFAWRRSDVPQYHWHLRFMGVQQAKLERVALAAERIWTFCELSFDHVLHSVPDLDHFLGKYIHYLFHDDCPFRCELWRWLPCDASHHLGVTAPGRWRVVGALYMWFLSLLRAGEILALNVGPVTLSVDSGVAVVALLSFFAFLCPGFSPVDKVFRLSFNELSSALVTAAAASGFWSPDLLSHSLRCGGALLLIARYGPTDLMTHDGRWALAGTARKFTSKRRVTPLPALCPLMVAVAQNLAQLLSINLHTSCYAISPFLCLPLFAGLGLLLLVPSSRVWLSAPLLLRSFIACCRDAACLKESLVWFDLGLRRVIE